ncbi:hypothetical protein D3C75_804810 [compost metagenome]
MQIVRGTFLVQVQLAVDVIHVMHHQAHRKLSVTRFDGIDQLHVLVIRTMRAVAAFVLGDDQRSLRHQAALEADQRRITRGLGQLEVEFAGKTNAGTAVTTGEAVALLAHHLPQFVELLEGSVLHGQFSDGPFDHAPGEEHLAGLFHRGAGHHRAAVRPQQHHAFVGQARQGAADDGAADAEDLAQRFLAQLGARCQTLLEDRLENMRVDDVVLGSAAPGLAGTHWFLERLQLFVHGHSSTGIGLSDPDCNTSQWGGGKSW